MKTFLLQAAELSFVTLYGSQLGQAKSIAESIVDSAPQYNLTSIAFPLNEVTDIIDLARLINPIVIVSSTTGDGEAPETADKFFRKLRRKSVSSNILDPVRYTILGLGDTNYNNFCNCAKKINTRFQELGGKLFYNPAWADDAIGLEDTVDTWLEDLWPALLKALNKENLIPNKNMSEEGKLTLPNIPTPFLNVKFIPDQSGSKNSPKPNLQNPPLPYPLIEGDVYKARVSNAILLTRKEALKTTLELTFELLQNDVGLNFEPGDALGIICKNDEDEVQNILKRLGELHNAHVNLELSQIEGAKGKIPAFLPTKSTLYNLLTYFIDIRAPPKKVLLRQLAESCCDEAQKSALLDLCSREGSPKYENLIRASSLSLLDILYKFPSASLKISTFLENSTRLTPRSYSISSSPLSSPNSFKIAFNKIEIREENGRMYARTGICSGYLSKYMENFNELEDKMAGIDLNKNEEEEEEDCVFFYKRKNHNFRLPDDLRSNVIMVGPGTGIAPFIGFIEHREKQLESIASSKSVKDETFGIGKLIVFYGCREKDKDFLYEEKLKKWEKNGLISLYVAFSREGEKKYVQDLIEENQKEIVEILGESSGYFYVCGDAQNMGKGVRERLVKCFQNVKEISEEEAVKEIGALVTSKRYLQDIWT